VTLVLQMSAPNAVCMSVDYRVTSTADGSVLDPFAVKSLIIRTSMVPGGPIALIGYAGLATHLDGKSSMGHWLRETLRGESQSLDDLMQLLLSQLNSQIATLNKPLLISVLCVNGPSCEQRHFGELKNTDDLRTTGPPTFTYNMCEIGNQQAFANGSGSLVALQPPYDGMLRAHMAKSDHTADDHMDLLANINRGVAEADANGQVSPYCFVTSVCSDKNWTPHCGVFVRRGETPPEFHMPLITCGIDASNLLEQTVRMGMMARSGAQPSLNEDELRRHVPRRP
jgi:hypothetical protein